MGARGPKPQPKKITAEHVRILEHIQAGRTNPDIAKFMKVTEFWVNDQLKIIFAVLGARTRAQAVALAIGRGIIRPLQRPSENGR